MRINLISVVLWLIAIASAVAMLLASARGAEIVKVRFISADTTTPIVSIITSGKVTTTKHRSGKVVAKTNAPPIEVNFRP